MAVRKHLSLFPGAQNLSFQHILFDLSSGLLYNKNSYISPVSYLEKDLFSQVFSILAVFILFSPSIHSPNVFFSRKASTRAL